MTRLRAVAVLIAVIVIFWWLSVQPNKETVMPPTGVKPQRSSVPTQEGKEASKEALQSPQADSKQEKHIATQFTLSAEGSQMVVVPGGDRKSTRLNSSH